MKLLITEQFIKEADFMKRKRTGANRITLLLCILLLVTSVASIAVLINQQAEENLYYSKTADTTNAGRQTVKLTADEFLDRITVGYNIGNSLDSCPETAPGDGIHDSSYYETYQGNPVISKEYITALRRSGFNTIRLPVSWSCNTYRENNRLVIREEWLALITEIVDDALAQNIYVILDSHHNTSITWADMNDIDQVSDNVRDLWTQIAEHFRDYDNRLIFESSNEINTKDDNWQYNEDSIEAVNILNQLFVDTVRACGEKNAGRILFCNTYLNETTDTILDGFVLPDDSACNKLAVSVHSYHSSYNQDIKIFFEKLQNYSKQFGAPIVITEFGTSDSFVPAEYRSNHAGNYIACANEYNIKCFWWDDGGDYRLFDRTTNEPVHEDIVDSLMNPAEFNTNKVSITTFDSIENYAYAAISPLTGKLETFSDGALTLNPDKQGFPVTYGYGYHISLSTTGNGDGLRLSGLCFYDSHQNLTAYHPLDQELFYDITPTQTDAFIRISLHNPWEHCSLEEFISFFEKGELRLEITQYIK